MERIYDACRDYAYEFSPRSGNLLLSGDPGLGKTFLSACIARVVSETGHSVVYDTAAHIFERFEAQKFSRDETGGADEDVSRLLRCDLLIIDDLGTELTTEFVRSAFYQIVNTRLMTNKRPSSPPTSPPPSSRAATARTSSRIEGAYRILPSSATTSASRKNKAHAKKRPPLGRPLPSLLDEHIFRPRPPSPRPPR